MGSPRVEVVGQRLVREGSPHPLRGVTYGSFLPRSDGANFPSTQRMVRDFRAMAEMGVNTLRIYDVPPSDLLDAAADSGLGVLAGVYYQDWRAEHNVTRAANRRVVDHGRRELDRLAIVAGDHEALMAISVGNEVPADVVRFHGVEAVRDGLGALCRHAHEVVPGALVTYTNFPTTEFLEVDGLDFETYNVFLEDRQAFRRYLTHLQVLSLGRPVVLTELGLSSAVHGQQKQADVLEWQLAEAQSAGLAGAIVFSWTDEWGVNGYPVDQWQFGLTTVEREPKPALSSVTRSFAQPITSLRDTWPSMSVVICAYNEERHIRQCLESVAESPYPGIQVIVCDDGSSDATVAIAEEFDVELLRLPHGGLSAARNAGWRYASGELVAFLDADAAATAEWPFQLALAFDDDAVLAAGGPNLASPDAGETEAAVDRCPGNPSEVLTGDDRAEHVAGCNMIFRRTALEAIGGFDVGYTSAGDDVDVCWKILDRQGQIAFRPAAVVHHHRRSSVRGFLRQQRGYGRAERMLSGPHPHRFNRLGQARWSGVVYGALGFPRTLFRPVVYHGWAGTAAYQPVQERRHEMGLALALAYLPFAPMLLGASVLVGLLWPPAFVASALALAWPLVIAAVAFTRADPPRTVNRRVRFRAIVAFLHVAAPFARFVGRVRGRPLVRPVAEAVPWTGDRVQWLLNLTRALEGRRLHTSWSGPHRPWDFSLTVGPLVRARLTTAVTWNWNPFARVRLRPRPAVPVLLLASAVIAFGAPLPATLLAVCTLGLATGEALLLRRRISLAISGTTRQIVEPAVAHESGRNEAMACVLWRGQHVSPEMIDLTEPDLLLSRRFGSHLRGPDSEGSSVAGDTLQALQ